jgi:hypothetical protein
VLRANESERGRTLPLHRTPNFCKKHSTPPLFSAPDGACTCLLGRRCDPSPGPHAPRGSPAKALGERQLAGTRTCPLRRERRCQDGRRRTPPVAAHPFRFCPPPILFTFYR